MKHYPFWQEDVLNLYYEKDLFKLLTEREAYCLELRNRCLTYKEIGKLLDNEETGTVGVTTERVRQIYNHSVRKIRRVLYIKDNVRR